MSDTSLLKDQLEMVLANGTPFSGSYHHKASVIPFSGVVDAYPYNPSGVIPGDLRLRVRITDVPGVLYFVGADTVVESSSGTAYNVISIIGEFAGYGACLQLRLVPTVDQGLLPPNSAGAYGVAGSMAFDSSYIYICVASNTWKRAALSSW